MKLPGAAGADVTWGWIAETSSANSMKSCLCAISKQYGCASKDEFNSSTLVEQIGCGYFLMGY